MIANPLSTDTSNDYGTPPHVDAEDASQLEVTEGSQHAINSPSQALAVGWRMKKDWEAGIGNAAAITAQLNGQRPRDPAVLKELGRNWLPNINSGILRVEAGKVPARLWQPINTATFLTAAKLPANWPFGLKKTGKFRAEVTEAIRSWRKWPWFMRQLAREVGFFGFGFAVHFDEYDWKPTFVRQDRAFVPFGFEILEETLPLFMVQYDYQPFDLLELVKDQREAKIEGGWDPEAVADAINTAGPKPRDGSAGNRRSLEEMIREASIGWAYEKGYNKIATYHIFSTDSDGTVSHHVVLAQDLANYGKNQADNKGVHASGDQKYLFEKRKQFKRMEEVVTVMMFDPDDGTVHGSWGAGQMLFDLSIEAEKSINDWMSSLKQAAKLKIQAGDGKTPDEVRLDVDDAMMVVTGGTYAGNTAAVTTDPKPFQALIESLSQLAREKIGSYIPPIPLQPTDIKAAQINAKQAEQEEVKQQIFQTWLWQFANLVENIVSRLCKADSPDETAKELRKKLLRTMNEDELKMLVNQNQIETIFEFTDLARGRRAMFCAQKAGNPFYNQKVLEEYQAEAAGGAAFMEAVLIPGDDATVEQGARRAQQEEASAMITLRRAVPVLPVDLDWYHMLELRPILVDVLNRGEFELGFIMLNHYKAHYVGAVAKQGMPKDRINVEKAFVAKVSKAIETGQLPQDGFDDKIDPIDEAQAMMGAGAVTTRGPSDEERAPESQSGDAGRESLVEELA